MKLLVWEQGLLPTHFEYHTACREVIEDMKYFVLPQGLMPHGKVHGFTKPVMCAHRKTCAEKKVS